MSVIWCLHDPANVQKASSKCIQNARVNCWTFARSCKHLITVRSSITGLAVAYYISSRLRHRLLFITPHNRNVRVVGKLLTVRRTWRIVPAWWLQEYFWALKDISTYFYSQASPFEEQTSLQLTHIHSLFIEQISISALQGPQELFTTELSSVRTVQFVGHSDVSDQAALISYFNHILHDLTQLAHRPDWYQGLERSLRPKLHLLRSVADFSYNHKLHNTSATKYSRTNRTI